MEWIHASNLQEISANDLYQILKLRQDVFILEQNCNYNDIDNLDQDSEHVFLKDDENVIGYSRIVPAGKKFEQPSIGRIVIQKSYRKKGYGKEIIERALNILSQRGIKIVVIEAQNHLQKFYESLGFKKSSDPYDVDGIFHIKMIHHIND